MASRTPSFLKPTLLVCALQAALPLLAQAQEAEPTTTQLEAITVTSSADASAEGLSKPYAGGQVARGGRAGILGTQDNMDTPFSITSYTNELIQDQQARGVADVLQNDPGVRMARGFGNFQETYFVRGFLLSSDDIAYNGLYGLLPRQYISTELFERVELLRGASAFLNGATPTGGGIGGTINLLPKRAPNEPLTRFSLGTGSGSQKFISADVARRFGPDDSSGIRVNASHREGGTGVQGDSSKLDLFSVAYDWRSRNARISADLSHQSNRLNATRPNVSLDSSLTAIPTAPDGKTNYAQPWSYSDERDTFGSVRAEYDINDVVTTWAAFGLRKSKENNSLAGVTVLNSTTGDANFYRFDNQREDEVKTAELGIRGKVRTGNVGHSLVASASYYELEKKNAYAMDFLNTLSTNIYNPTSWAQPAYSGSLYSGNLNNPQLQGETKLTSFAVGDTLSLLDDRLLITLGLRHQKLEDTSYTYDVVFGGTQLETAGVPTSYSSSHTSPAFGIVYKTSDQFSVYANYIESLAKGDTAPLTTGSPARPVQNGGTVFGAYVAKQKEIGLKYDGGRLGGNLTFFSTEKPRGYVDATDTYVTNGKDRHQGVELSVYGEATKGLRILGGLSLLDAKQKQTGNAATEGKRVIGVPKTQANLGLDWDVPGVQGLSLNGRIVNTGSFYADSANTLRVKGWTRLDLGARYLTEIQGKLVTFRARVDNATDKNYWASAGGYPDNGYLVLANPRTFSLTASIDF